MGWMIVRTVACGDRMQLRCLAAIHGTLCTLPGGHDPVLIVTLCRLSMQLGSLLVISCGLGVQITRTISLFHISPS